MQSTFIASREINQQKQEHHVRLVSYALDELLWTSCSGIDTLSTIHLVLGKKPERVNGECREY